MRELLSLVVPELAPKWWKLGLFLDIDPVVLDTIQSSSNVRVDASVLCKEMFQKWLNEDPLNRGALKTWKSVVEAVRRGHGEAAADEIERKLEMHAGIN